MRRRDSDNNLAFLDHVLCTVSASVAVCAASLSVGSENNAAFFTALVVAGTICSLLVVRFLGQTKFVLADASVYTLAAVTAALAIGSLNLIMPDQVYEGNLAMPGVLCWMLALGSFAIWRDQTMLFQAVPGIALFGLVGCYDTFRASVIYFFAFLVCEAILLARAHGRAMLRQARATTSDYLELSAMRRGPWRSMAGPEWALASAITIVLVSTIGAPILRESASSFSGLVRYAPPMAALAAASVVSPGASGVRVGTGPNVVRNTPVFLVKVDEPRYLRGFVFGAYENGSWLPRGPVVMPDNSTVRPMDVVLGAIDDKKEITFTVRSLFPSESVPVPGEVQFVSGSSSTFYRRNTGGSFASSGPSSPPLEGTSVVSNGSASIGDAQRLISELIPSYGQSTGIPGEVADLARRVTAGKKTDFDKAVAIQREIERRALYNLNAAATPAGTDPVSYFLFSSKEGYCDLFASSMALMARSIGLPARYVTGYYPFDSRPDEDGNYVVRAKDAHAWCEILFKGRGWVIFDATEGAQSVDGGERGSVNDQPLWSRPWVVKSIFAVGVGGLAFLGYIRLRRYRRMRGSPAYAALVALKSKRKIRRQLDKTYVAFERKVRRLASRPRHIGETISEYVGAAGERVTRISPQVRSLAEQFGKAFYSAADPSLEEIKGLKEAVRLLVAERRA